MTYYTGYFRTSSALMMVTIMSVSFPLPAETLYNGIQLPEAWPPERPPSREPMSSPYLENPPPVIPIDVGRQLFVDDFLIADTDLKRVYHQSSYYEGNPVLKPEKPWEIEGESQGHPAPTAMPFSDGVWHDPQDKLFKMWYMAGYVKRTCYATAKDGIYWERPVFDVVPGTNIVHTAGRDSSAIWLDLFEKDPQRRYKAFFYEHPEGSGALTIYFSSDGIHWGNPAGRSGPTGDRSTAFYNPFRGKWVYSIRAGAPGMGRMRRYSEGADVLAAAHWESDKAPFWVGADTLDPQRDDLKTVPELYNLDAVAYESVLLGLFSIWYGQPHDRAKPNQVCLGFSRDGFHWVRPTHEPFIPVSENYGDWNWANVQSAGGGCLVVGDKLYFYVSGRAGVRGSPASGVSSTGLALLRRDGFASMQADATGGTLTTRPLTFSGKFLFVNAAASNGELRVEMLDEAGNSIVPFTVDGCKPLAMDSVIQRVTWNDADDLSKLAGKPVRFRFHLRNGALYAFWVSPEPSGASHGYVAAGGPGFTGPTDTVGDRLPAAGSSSNPP
ncbi:MAG: hypothetical protein HY706_05895 [Candidatus Hydrogenedentes bacterium]|nr:hypothetical protein [Candidatus Hydrogenedentota bacterium]